MARRPDIDIKIRNIHWKGILLTIAVVIFLVAGISLGNYFAQRAAGDSDYTAVLMNTGDMYFGKMSWFPHLAMTDVWYLQKGLDKNNQPQAALAPMKNVFWGPARVVYLNRSNIVWWSPVPVGTDFEKALTGNLPPQQQAQPPAANPAPAPATTSAPSSSKTTP